MRRTIACILAVWLLAACGANDADSANTLTLPPTTTATTTTATATSESAAAPSRNDRNNIVKAFGELASTVSPGGIISASFTVDSIEVDAPCTGFPQPAENGHLLVLNMRVTTADLSSLGGDLLILAEDWQVIGADGITEANVSTAAAYSCMAEAEQLPESMGPGQQFVGKLVLDSKSTSGSVIFSPPYIDGGWEWVY